MKALISGEAALAGVLGSSPWLRPVGSAPFPAASQEIVMEAFRFCSDVQQVEVSSFAQVDQLARIAAKADTLLRLIFMAGEPTISAYLKPAIVRMASEMLPRSSKSLLQKMMLDDEEARAETLKALLPIVHREWNDATASISNAIRAEKEAHDTDARGSSFRPLMPKATAVWLIENTSLTFFQIADFCGLHELEVTHLAQKEGLSSIRGADPIARGDLERAEIEKGEKDEEYRMKASGPANAAAITKKAPPRYTPVSRRQDRPDAIAWMVRNHPEVPDAQTAKLLGTTKATIESVRNRSHWNSANIKPVDPVTLGLCTQIELDAIVGRAAELNARLDLKNRGRQDAPLSEAEVEASEDWESATNFRRPT